jgi:hypothetical protein
MFLIPYLNLVLSNIVTNSKNKVAKCCTKVHNVAKYNSAFHETFNFPNLQIFTTLCKMLQNSEYYAKLCNSYALLCKIVK